MIVTQHGRGPEAERVIGMLRDELLPGPEGLDQITSHLQTHTTVPCRFVVEGEPGLTSSEARLTLYRVAQEAVAVRLSWRVLTRSRTLTITIQSHSRR